MFKQLPVFVKLFIIIFLINIVFSSAYNCLSKPTMGLVLDNGPSRGEKLFKANCSGCHLNGQNLIKPDKPIIGSLKLKSKQLFETFISAPPPMPNFKNIVSKQGELNALHKYVISLMGK